jgi:hypothetical protein
MGDPVVYDCPQETWTQIATAVKVGLITILEAKASYRLTYRTSPSTEPTTPEEIEESPKVQSLQVDISSEADIDVYIYAVKGLDGKVTVYT